MKRRICTLLMTIIVMALGISLLSACKPEEKPVIKPTSWQIYVEELQEIFNNTYSTTDLGLGFAVNAELKSSNDLGESKSFKLDAKLNLSLKPDNTTDGLSISIHGNDVNGVASEIFSMYANNERIYLHIYEAQYDKHSYYKYSNTPLFDIIRQAFGESTITEISPLNLLNYLSQTIFTSATVNENKTVYTCGFAMENILNDDVSSALETLMRLFPEDIKSEFLKSIGVKSDMELLMLLANLKGEVIFNVKDGKITNINISSLQGLTGRTVLDIKSLIIAPNYIIGVNAAEPSNIEDYNNVKIGTVSVEGSITGKDSKDINTLIKYDMSFNASIDILQLLANGGDVRSLDENNYFHFNLSHKCNSYCTDYCSVGLGNKLRQSNGSVLDIAFSPKDFGTYNIYVSVSLGAFLGEDKLISLLRGQISNGIERLSPFLISDYQLFAIDLGARLDLAKELSNESDAVAENSMQPLLDLYSILNFKRWSMDINLEELKQASTDIGELSAITGAFCNILQSYNVENLDIDLGMPQYDAVSSYNIADALLFIPALDIDDNVLGTKQYNNALFSGQIKPSLSWDFNIGESDNGTYVNTLLYGSDYKEILYDVNNPISADELKNLNNAYIAYNYKDIWGNSGGSDYVGYAKIYGAYGVDYSNTSTYQSVLLKVGYPSAVISDFSSARNFLKEFFGEMLYTTVRVNIKLSEIDKSKITVERTSRTSIEGGTKETDEYKLYDVKRNEILQATVKYVYSMPNGQEKTKPLTQYGTCTFFDIKYGLLGGINYVVNSTGKQKLVYNICGERIEKFITIIPPKDSSLQSTATDFTFKIGEKIDITKLEKVSYNYSYPDSKTYNYTVPFYYATISGRSINDGVDRWGIEGNFQEDNKIVTSIVFYREGRFEIGYEYLGKKASFYVNIVSKNEGKSEYKLTSSKVKDHYFVGEHNYDFDYTLDNKTHGTQGRDNQILTVEITRGTVNSSGTLMYYAAETNKTEYLEFVIKYDNVIIDNKSTVDLEALILNPHKIKISVKFKVSGYYRIKLSVGFSGASSTTDILLENYDSIQ